MMYEDLLGKPIRAGDKVIALIRLGVLATKDDPIEGWWQTTVYDTGPERVQVVDHLHGRGESVVNKFPHNLIVVDKEWTDSAIELHVKILFGDIPKR